MGIGRLLTGVCAMVATPLAGPLVAAVMVKKEVDDARWEGKQSGINETSKVYEEKLRKQAEEFFAKEKVAKEDKEKLFQLVMEYKKALDEKEALLKDMKQINSDAFDIIANLENEIEEMHNQYNRLSHLLCA